jgi:hypothetical protein
MKSLLMLSFSGFNSWSFDLNISGLVGRWYITAGTYSEGSPFASWPE